MVERLGVYLKKGIERRAIFGGCELAKILPIGELVLSN